MATLCVLEFRQEKSAALVGIEVLLADLTGDGAVRGGFLGGEVDLGEGGVDLQIAT